MSVQPIKAFGHRTIRFQVAVYWITVQGIGNRLALAHGYLQMYRGDVIMVIVAPTAMTTPLVKFARQQSIGFAIILDRIENGYAICSQCNGSPKEITLRRHRMFCRNRTERNAPSVASYVRLRQRDLLLPSRDPLHHAVVGHAV